MVPRSVEAIHAFYEAQDGLGEPWGNNDNWITRACGIIDAWCVMTAWMARLAAGFNPTGQILDFGSPDNPPAWAQSLPDAAGVGFGSTYRWGSAYVWAEKSYAESAGRWTTDFDRVVPGATVCVNHNGRGGARNVNSHLAEFIGWAPDGSALTWNGNVSNSIRQARWSKDVIEGFCLPDLAVASSPSKEDELFSHGPLPTWHLVASHSGLLVEFAGFPPIDNGRPVVASPADGGLDQRWQPWGHDDGSISLVNRSQEKAIDVPNNDAKQGKALAGWEFNASAAQRFLPEWVAPNLVKLRHAASGLVVDSSGGQDNMAEGAPLILWTPHGGRNQQFLTVHTI